MTSEKASSNFATYKVHATASRYEESDALTRLSNLRQCIWCSTTFKRVMVMTSNTSFRIIFLSSLKRSFFHGEQILTDASGITTLANSRGRDFKLLLFSFAQLVKSGSTG